MKNSKLAITIPTYNKCEILRGNLLYMLNDLKKFNIPIYISDDSDNDETKNMINELKTEYNLIYYIKNDHNLGHDKNYVTALRLPEEEYVWCLGDSIIIKQGSIEKILTILQDKEYCFLSVNADSRRLRLPTKHYTDPQEAFIDLAWHLTLTGATIYNKKALYDINYLDYIYHKNFPQVNIIFSNLLVNVHGLYWLGEKIIFQNKNKKRSYWSSKAFEVFVYDWYRIIMALPDNYSLENKYYVIKSHDVNTKIFGIRNLLNLRTLNGLNCKNYRQYNYLFPFTIKYPKPVILLIALLPRIVIKILKRFWKANG
jgi:hypothetical protein